MGAQNRLAAGALIVELAGIRWHGLALRVPASGTRDGRLKHRRGHGIALSEEDRLRAAWQRFSVAALLAAEGHLGGERGHARTSIACRNPSLTRLKESEVTKIANPGKAQIIG